MGESDTSATVSTIKSLPDSQTQSQALQTCVLNRHRAGPGVAEQKLISVALGLEHLNIGGDG